MVERRIRGDRRLAFERPLVDADAQWNRGEQPHRFSEFGLVTVVLALRVEMTEEADGGPHHAHRMGVGTLSGDLRDRVGDRIRDHAHRDEVLLEGRQFFGGRLVPDQQQEGDLFKGGVRREIGDLVAAIDQLRLVDRADAGLPDGLAGEAAGVGGTHVWSFRGGKPARRSPNPDRPS